MSCAGRPPEGLAPAGELIAPGECVHGDGALQAPASSSGPQEHLDDRGGVRHVVVQRPGDQTPDAGRAQSITVARCGFPPQRWTGRVS